MAVWRHWMGMLASALRLLVLAAAALGSSGTSAQGRPRIDGFDVERVAELVAGTRLNFSVFGSPGAQVVLQIEGVRRPVPLRELQPGVYDGSHVLEPGESIAADARVVATLRSGGDEVRAMLDEPLLLGDRLPAASARGADLRPSAEAPPPTESRPSAGPLPAAEAHPSAGPQPLAEPLPSAQEPARRTAPPAAPPADGPSPARGPAAPAPEPALCPDCALVESIRPLPTDKRPPPSAAGHLLGGLFGERVGAAVEHHVARVTGAVERAVLGRPLDEAPAGGTEVVLRLPNGQRLLRIYDRAPDLRVGDVLRRGSGLGGARSERLLDSLPSPHRRPPPKSQQLAGLPVP